MAEVQRSGCPINLSLEVRGDKWSLPTIRDMMFGNRRHFRELPNKSEEGIPSNIHSDRLRTLLDEGIITRADDLTHKAEGHLFADRTWHRAAADPRADGCLGLQISACYGRTRHSRQAAQRRRPDHGGRADGRAARNPSRLETEASNRPKCGRPVAGGPSEGDGEEGQRLTSARRNPRLPDERRGTSSLTHTQKRQLSPSWESY